MIPDGVKESTLGRIGAKLRGLLSMGWQHEQAPSWGTASGNGEPGLGPDAAAELALLRQVVDGLPQHIFAKDRDGRFIMANRAKAAHHGVTPQQLLGMRLEDLPAGTVPPDVDFRGIERKVQRTGASEVIERYDSTSADGEPTVRTMLKLPLRDARNRPSGVVSIADDITTIDRAERRARESEERFRQVAEATPYALFVAREKDGRILYANRATASVFGFSDDPTRHAAPELYWDPTERAALLDVLEREGAYSNYELRHRRADGSPFWGLVSSSRIQFGGQQAILTSLVDITELRDAQAAALRNQDLLQAVFDNLPGSLFVKDPQRRYVAANRHFAELFDTPVEACLGLTWPELAARAGVLYDEPDDTEAAVLVEGRAVELTESRIEFADGRHQVSHVFRAPLRDAEGRITGLIGVGIDVTAQLRQAQALRASESMLRRAQEVGGIGTWRRHMDSDAVEWSAQSYRIWGVEPDGAALHYQAARARVHPDDLPEWDSVRARAISEGGRFDHIARIIHGDGSQRHVRIVGEVVCAEDGTPLEMLGVTQDVTEAVEARMALERQEWALSRAQSIGGIGTWWRDLDSDTLHWEPETYRIWGMDPGTPVTLSGARERVHPDDRAAFDASRDAALRDDDRFDVHHRVLWPDGSVRHMHTVGEVQEDRNGRAHTLLGVTHDETERIEAEAELRRGEQRYRALVENSLQGINVRVDGEVVFANAAIARYLGYDSTEAYLEGVRGKRFAHSPGGDREQMAGEYARLQRGEIDSIQGERDVIRLDGGVVRILARSSRTEWDGKPATLVTSIDITDLHRVREDLRRSEQRARAVLDRSVQAVVVSVDGKIVFANEVTAQMLGYDSAEAYLVAARKRLFSHEADPELTEEILARLQNRTLDQFEGERTLIRRDGQKIRAHVRSVAFEWEGRRAVLSTGIDFTDLFRAQEALRASEQRYRALLDYSVQAVTVHIDGKAVFANPTAAQVLGHADVEAYLAYAGNRAFPHSADPGQVAKMHAQLQSGALDKAEGEFELLRQDGTKARLYMRAQRFDWDGQAAVLSTGVDITDRHRVQQALRDSEQRFRAIAEHLPLSLTIIDQETGTLLFGNEGFRAEFGIADALENHHVSEFYFDDADREPVLEEYRTKGHYGPREVRFRKGDGSVFWALASGAAIDYGGRAAYLSTWIDLSERKAAEARLRESQGLLRQLIDVVPHFIHVKDSEGRLVLVNRAFAAFHALEPEQAVGKRSADLPGMRPDVAGALDRADREAMEAADLRAWSGMTIVGAEGTPRQFEVTKVPLWGEAGRLSGLVTVSQDITERIRAEDTLRESEARFRNLLEGSIQGVVIHKDRKPLYVNEAYSRLLGYDSPDDILAIGDLDRIVTERERERVRQLAADRSAGIPAPEVYETESYRKDGSIVNLLVGSRLVEWDGDTVIQSTLVDITERRRAEDELRSNRRLLETVIDAIPMMVFAKDTNSNYILVNRAMAEFFGLTKEAFLHRNTAALPVPDATRTKAIGDDQWVLEHGEPLLQAETRHEDPNGIAVPFHSTKLPLFDDDGDLVGLVGINRDISEEMRAQAELRESRDLLRTIIDTIPHGVFVRDREGRYVLLNRAQAAKWGRQPEDMLGMRVPYEGQPEGTGSEPLSESDRQVLDSGQIVRTEGDRMLADGKLHTLFSIKAPLLDAEGRIAGIVGIAEDITERKQAETERLRYMDLLNSVINSAPIILWAVDPDGMVTLSEGKGLEYQNIGSSDIVNRNLFELYADYPEFLDLVRSALAGKAVVGTNETRGAVYERWMYPVTDADGNSAGVIGVSLEVTQRYRTQQELERYRTHLEELVLERTGELREAQAELVTKERLAALGLLTGVVSHELRNPLGTIRTSIFTVREASRHAGLELDRTLDRIDRNIIRCDRIIEELLTYTRPTIGAPEPVLIDELVAEVLDEGAVVPAGVLVQRDLHAGAKVEIDRERLRRCLINVVQNAAQAITEQAGRDEGNIWVSTAHADGRLEVRVSDDGPGIPPENREHLFEPLFSTKGFGVGLGLPIVKQIMEAHGGGIVVENAEQGGASVVLWLPLR